MKAKVVFSMSEAISQKLELYYTASQQVAASYCQQGAFGILIGEPTLPQSMMQGMLKWSPSFIEVLGPIHMKW